MASYLLQPVRLLRYVPRPACRRPPPLASPKLRWLRWTIIDGVVSGAARGHADAAQNQRAPQTPHATWRGAGGNRRVAWARVHSAAWAHGRPVHGRRRGRQDGTHGKGAGHLRRLQVRFCPFPPRKDMRTKPRVPDPARFVCDCRGFLDKDFSLWRFTFLGGMALGALGASVMMPGAIVDLPKSFTVGIPFARLPESVAGTLGVALTAIRLPTVAPPTSGSLLAACWARFWWAWARHWATAARRATASAVMRGWPSAAWFTRTLPSRQGESL